jgi:hypothetical protein
MQETVRPANGAGSRFEQTFKNLDDVLWKEAGCTTELDYTEQSSWMLFLKYLDDLEHERSLKAELAQPSLLGEVTGFFWPVHWQNLSQIKGGASCSACSLDQPASVSANRSYNSWACT